MSPRLPALATTSTGLMSTTTLARMHLPDCRMWRLALTSQKKSLDSGPPLTMCHPRPPQSSMAAPPPPRDTATPDFTSITISTSTLTPPMSLSYPAAPSTSTGTFPPPLTPHTATAPRHATTTTPPSHTVAPVEKRLPQ